MARAGINRRQLITLLKLRGKLTLRQFTRERGRIISVVLVILVFGPMIVGASIGTTIGYRRLPDQWPTALLGGVLALLWFIWLVFPIIFATINEGLDVTRLLVFPLSTRTLAVGTILGTLFDYPTFLVLPLFVAALIGFGLTPALPVILLALLLSYAHMVVIGQLALTALGGILSSRRVRDVAIVLFSLLGSSCYFINIGMERLTENLSGRFSEEQILSLQPLNWLQWLPTGAPARAVQQATNGAWGGALLWLGYSALLLLAIGWVWQVLLQRLATGSGFVIGSRTVAQPEEPKPKRARRASGNGRLLSRLPADIRELFIKELKSVWRIPQRRVALIQGVLFPFIAGGAFIFSGDSPLQGGAPGWLGIVLLPYALFMYWATTQNMLGWEGNGLATLLLTPAPRQRVFLGKGLALLLVAGGPYLMIGLLMLVTARSWLVVVGLLTGLSMGMATIAVTAVASVLFPIPINLEAKRTRSTFQSGGGCRTGLGSTFLVPLAIAAVSAPAAAPMLIAWWLGSPAIGYGGLLLSWGYALVLFWYSTRLAGNLLLEREAEVLAALHRPEVE